jgi:hypothetical protein
LARGTAWWVPVTGLVALKVRKSVEAPYLTWLLLSSSVVQEITAEVASMSLTATPVTVKEPVTALVASRPSKPWFMLETTKRLPVCVPHSPMSDEEPSAKVAVVTKKEKINDMGSASIDRARILL